MGCFASGCSPVQLEKKDTELDCRPEQQKEGKKNEIIQEQEIQQQYEDDQKLKIVELFKSVYNFEYIRSSKCCDIGQDIQSPEITSYLRKTQLRQRIEELIKNDDENMRQIFQTALEEEQQLVTEQNIAAMNQEPKMSIKLKISCPPQCACHNNEEINQKFWQFLECKHICYLNEDGYLFCQQSCVLQFVLWISFRCDKDFQHRKYPLFDLLFQILDQAENENLSAEHHQNFKNKLIAKLLIKNFKQPQSTSIVHPYMDQQEVP